MALEFDTSLLVALPIIVFVGVAALLRLRMEKRIAEVPNFSSSMCFIGPASAINFDFDSSRVAYIELSQKEASIFQSEDLVIAGKVEYALTETIPKGFLTRFVNAALNGEHLVTINTNVYDLPELKVAFWDKRKAQQCIIALRQLGNAQFTEQDKCDTERPDCIIRNPQGEQLVKELNEVLSQEISENGGIRNIRDPRERDRYIDFSIDWVEHRCGRKLKRGDNQIIASALLDFLGEDKNDNGYEESSLLSFVSHCKTNGKKTRKIKR